MKVILLTKGLSAWVDDADYEKVSQYKWTAKKVRRRWYAVRNIGSQKTKHIYLHRFILGVGAHKKVDHKNGDGLDCRRDNLRGCTTKENNRAFKTKSQGTTSWFRGVSWDSKNEKWRAKIVVDYKTIHLGRFVDEIEAARAYDSAAIKYYGEFASPNFPCH